MPFAFGPGISILPDTQWIFLFPANALANMKNLGICMLLFAIHTACPAQSGQQQAAPLSIAIMPPHANGLDSVSVETADMILRTEIGKLGTMDIVSSKRTRDALGGAVCIEIDCALDLGKKLNASQVLGCRFSALGEKIIAQYFLVDVLSGREILVDQATARNVEELEMVMKRIASSVVNLAPMDKSAEVGKVLPTEASESLRKTSRNNFGLSFGYLYPQYGYDNSDRSFVVDGRFDHELEDWAVGMTVGIRKGFAMNLYGSYLLSRKDLCPYIGGAFGFHWVDHIDYLTASYGPARPNSRSDGFELIGNVGLRVLHTYNFQMLFNLEYIFTINDYNDRALVFTIGFL
jgi:hypothetical protein